MIWKVSYTENARQDLRDIHDYIAYTLLEPEIAQNQTNRIMDAVDSLDHMPLRYPRYGKEPWRSKGLRFLPVDNYVAFYLPIEAQSTVTIIRIMYGGRDIAKQLNTPE